MLSLPAVGHGVDSEALNRFAIVVELISRNLCLFRGDDVFGLVHFHPAYERNQIHPIKKPAYGHLPPQGWPLLFIQQYFNTNFTRYHGTNLLLCQSTIKPLF